MAYFYKQRPLKSADGRNTTFSVDSKGVVFDRINGWDGTMVKVGKMNGHGDITVLPKYARKHNARLQQLVAKEEAAC